MSQSGSGQSMSEDSTESQQSGPIASKPRPDFGKKHKKVVRILTVIAYMISVSTAAVLLSAYYVFLWNPEKTEKSTESSLTTLAMARSYPQLTSHHFSQQMSPYKYSSLGLPQYAQFVDVHSHHSHTNSKHVAHLKSQSHKTSSSPYFLSQQQHLLPTPQSLIMQNILKSSTIPLTPFTDLTSTVDPNPNPTVPSSPIPTRFTSESTFASAFPSLSSFLSSSSSLNAESNVAMNFPENDATPAEIISRVSSILPTNPTNSYTRTLLTSPKASTITIYIQSSDHSPDSDSDLESVDQIENTKTTNDHHGEPLSSVKSSTPSGHYNSFPQRDTKLSDIGNPIIIMS